MLPVVLDEGAEPFVRDKPQIESVRTPNKTGSRQVAKKAWSVTTEEKRPQFPDRLTKRR